MSDRLSQNSNKVEVALAILRYHVVIYVVTCLLAVTIGFTLIGSFLSVFLLNMDFASFRFFWRVEGLCGDFKGIRDLSIVTCRLFYSSGHVYLVYLPFLVCFILAWSMQCIHSRRFIYMATHRQRFQLVLAMSTVSLGHSLLGLTLLPKYIMFTGPVNDFHPMMPLILSLSQLFTPLIFWVIVSKVDKRRHTDHGEG
jgi:hypothetical protein